MKISFTIEIGMLLFKRGKSWSSFLGRDRILGLEAIVLNMVPAFTKSIFDIYRCLSKAY